MKYVVYKITNVLNSYIYIGVHCTYNINDNYMGSGVLLKEAIKIHGIHNFKKEILFIYDNKTEMLEKERELVDKKFTMREDTYNICLGGGELTMYSRVVVKDNNGDTHNINMYDYRKDPNMIHINSGMMPAKDINGNIYQVSINDSRLKTDELKSIFSGKCSVRDKYGTIYHVDTDDIRIKTGELVSISTGYVSVEDVYGNRSRVKITDPLYISGELKSVVLGKVSVKDKDGNKFQVSIDDERYLSGILSPINKGKVSVKDKDGNKFQVSIDDERYLSGELVGISRNRKWIHNKLLNINKCVSIEDLSTYIDNNWQLGRKK